MRIAVFEAEEWEREACLSLEPQHSVACTADALAAEATDRFADAQVISPFVNSDLSATVLRRFPRLELIATRSTGYDHIDLDYCRQHKVTVCNVPDYGDQTVAEHAFALLLALIRHVPEASARARQANFSQQGLRGFELAGKVMGVVGVGRIGRRVIAIARGFGMDVVAYDRAPVAEAVRTLGFRYAPLNEVLATADVLSLHVPGGAGSRSLISDAEFGRMKPGAILVNTARGGVVDAQALVRALHSGRLAGAALDVIAQERRMRDEAEIFRERLTPSPESLQALLADHALLHMPNVLVTPHIAYNTEEAVHRIIDTTLANILAFAHGTPQNVVASPSP